MALTSLEAQQHKFINVSPHLPFRTSHYIIQFPPTSANLQPQSASPWLPTWTKVLLITKKLLCPEILSGEKLLIIPGNSSWLYPPFDGMCRDCYVVLMSALSLDNLSMKLELYNKDKVIPIMFKLQCSTTATHSFRPFFSLNFNAQNSKAFACCSSLQMTWFLSNNWNLMLYKRKQTTGFDAWRIVYTKEHWTTRKWLTQIVRYVFHVILFFALM